MKNLNKILLVVAMISILGSSYSCLAQSDAKYTVLAPLPCIESAETTYIDSQGQSRTNPGITCEGNGSVATEVDFKTYVQYTMNLLIALSAVVAVVMLVWGGIEYMFTSSFSSKKSGLERAQNALVGLLLVLTSYIILRTVDPRLVEIPNTLVPQLTVREELREDVFDSFTTQLENEITEYDKNRTKLGEELTDIRRKRAELAEKEKDLQRRIASSTDPVEINKLKVELEKTMEENIQKKAVDIVKKATIAINGNLDEIAKIVLEGRDYQHQDKFDVISRNMGLLNKHLANMQIEYAVATEELGKIRVFDSTSLRDQRNHYTTIGRLDMLNLSIGSITGSNNYYDVILTNGTKDKKRGPVLKEEIQTEINSLQRFIDATTDTELKQKMVTKKAQVEAALKNKLP
jgi:hypothetical protein